MVNPPKDGHLSKY